MSRIIRTETTKCGVTYAKVHYKGRPPEHKVERDCVVRTLSTALGLSYNLAHRTLEAAGRKNNKGMFAEQYYPIYRLVAKKKGKQLKYILGPKNETVSEFVKKHKKGNYIVRVRGHVFNLRESLILDNWIGLARPRQIVRLAHKVITQPFNN